MMNNKFFILVSGLLILIVIALIVLSNIIRGSNVQNNVDTTVSGTPKVFETPTPVKLPEEIRKLQTIQKVPTLNPTKGQGLDLHSAEIQNSIKEINKIKSKLPYKKTFTSGSGMKVDILIPSANLMDNEWTLMVNILSIDYKISENDPQFEQTKDSFRQAALDVFFWLKENNVNTEKIIIKWGDREFMQKRSEEWLQ